MRHFGFKSLTGIEGYLPDAEMAKQNSTHDVLINGDARKLNKYFQPGQFDACVAMDIIEHLTKADGMELIRSMEWCASKKIIFTTPSGFLPQGHTDNADLQAHLSGWEPAEMQALGYSVIGMLGPKNLRGNTMYCAAVRKSFGASSASLLIFCGPEGVRPRRPRYCA